MKQVNPHLGERVERLRLYIWIVAANMTLLLAAAIALGLRGVRLLVVLAAGLVVMSLLALGLEQLLNRASRVAVNLWSATSAPEHRRGYSEIDAVIIRGRTDDAIDRYRDIIAAQPDAVEPRIRLALLLLQTHGAVGEATALLWSARQCAPDTTDERRIGNALIDLYRANGETALLKAELARFARLNQDTGAGRAARAALRQIVADQASQEG
jgi:hypothetical protein